MFKDVNGMLEKFSDQKSRPKMFKDSQELIAKHNPAETEIPVVDIFTANIILFSYNRPRMLREAILSVLGQTYQRFRIFVMDDGSDIFDPVELIDEFEDERIIPCIAPRMTPEERVDPENTRFADNLNYVIDQIPREDNFLVYLCDDDVLHPNWLAVANYMLYTNPSYHSINGNCYYFYDGENPFKDGREGFLSNITPESQNLDWLIWWQMGTFAMRLTCVDEGVRWSKSRGGHSWDIEYCKSIWEHTASYIHIHAPSVYRREHDNALSYKLGRFHDGAYSEHPMELTPEHVTSPME